MKIYYVLANIGDGYTFCADLAICYRHNEEEARQLADYMNELIKTLNKKRKKDKFKNDQNLSYYWEYSELIKNHKNVEEYLDCNYAVRELELGVLP